MPTVSVGRDLLFEALGRTYTQDEFQELCFQFGIELDDVTTEKEIIRKEKHLKEDDDFDGGEEIIYKIEVPANRYDLLCLEGIVQSLRIFCGVDSVPNYTLASISKQSMLKMHVKPETSLIRPYVVCAVLRAITFNEARYNSFIGLQDKLHQNICSRRTLVAIGTHDLDTIEGPFTYEALPPTEIEFKPLKQVESFRADKLMEFYKSDLKLNKYVHIIKDSPVYPVIYDRNRRVLSLPPIINGAHSAISLKTKNVFIECTATDLTKAKIVLNTMVTMFSIYCEKKFEVEPVEVIYPDGKTYVCPDLSPYDMEVSLPYINGIVGVPLETIKVAELLNKMQLEAKKSVSSDNECIFTVSVPAPTRSDVLHACDVAEDVAIAYGYSEIPKQKPSSIKPLLLNEFNEHIPLSLNQFRDLIIDEVAMYGFSQVILFNLCSYKNHFPMLNRKDDKSTVIIANPSSVDCQVSQSSLMTGMLKTLAHSKDHAKPIKIFEVADVVLLDELKDVGASNQLHLAALYCNSGNPFEADGDNSGYHYYMRVIQWLVDRIMEVTGNPFESGIVESDEPEFLPGGQAAIILEGKRIGAFGVVHPQVLENFGIQDPCSFLELNLESVQLHAKKALASGAYGFNEMLRKPLPLNQFSKHIILEIAMCGYKQQVKAFNLCSYKDFSHMLNREDEKSTVATDFEVMRCIVMAGMLKTFAHRKDDAKPIKIFEVGDVVLSARNHRHLGAVYCGATSGFELIHGLVDRIMEASGYRFVSSGDNTGYYIVKSDEPEFLSGRQATIILKGKPIGTFGIVHPQVLENFGTQDPCSFVNLNVESLL